LQDGLDEFKYRQVPALFRGWELSGQRRLIDGPRTLDLGLKADSVRAVNRASGEPLPRIAPWRVGASLNWAQAAWTASLGADHAGAQLRVPATAGGQRPGTTEAYSLWNAAASYRQQAGPTQLLWYARLDNLTNALAYSATSVLTTTVFPKAPLPGRSLKVGLRLAF
jgi:iron complex outermembrane receptor protein